MTNAIRTWRLAAVAGLTLGAFACSEAGTDILAPDGPISAPQLVIDLSDTGGGSENVNDAIWTFPVPFNVGTGQINPFLSVQADPNEEGFNTDGALPLDTKRPSFTNALPLNHVPTIEGPGMDLFREIILDANESNSEPDALFSIDRFDLWLCDDPDAATYEARSEFQSNADCALVYDIDDDIGGSDTDFIQATDAVTSGSGLDLDYQILIPEANFIAAAGAVGADLSDCAYQGVEADPCGAFLILDVRMGFQGGDLVTGATFEEFSTIKRPFVNVSKTAETSFTRTYTWEIDKEIDPTGAACGGGALTDFDAGPPITATVQANEVLDVCYTVTVDTTGFEDSDWAVEGAITIENPSDDDVVIEGVTDEISGFGAVTVSCPVTFPHTLGDGDTLVCTYEADLSNGDTRTNTATVDIEDLAVGVAMAEVNFASAEITEIDECVDVVDTFEGVLGQVCASDPPPTTFDYIKTFTGEDVECGPNTFVNVATGTANDTGTEVTDDETIDIEVVCEEGCTLTQGYWKTHNESFHGGASKKADPTWFDLGDADGDFASEGELETFFLSGGTYFDAMWTAPKGNQYWQLSRQYIAAVLNTLANATPPADVQDAIDAATVFFETFTPAQASALPKQDPGTPGVIDSRDEIVAAAGLLTDFNEGLVGPGHCTENEETAI